MDDAPAAPSMIWVYQRKSVMPDWVKEVVTDDAAPNGTFLLKSEMGQVRVHPGNVVFRLGEHVYACPHSEVRATMDEIKSRFAPAPPKGVSVPGARVAVADVAPLDDVTDDITRRIRQDSAASAPAPKAVPQYKPAAPQPAVAPQAEAATPPELAQPKKWPAQIGNPPSVENRRPEELHLDESYQRSTDNGSSQALIRRIAAGWDWRMCLPLVVSKRDDGTLWVIDGQHRLAAARLRGDIGFLPCCVGVYGSVADEAAMFVQMNRARKAMNRLDDFHAALVSGDGEATVVAQLIMDAGFTVARKTGSQSWVPGEVAFTSAIAKVLRKHGSTLCALTLRTMADAFPGQVLAAGSAMFLALAKIAVNPPKGFDHERMFRALSAQPHSYWASFIAGQRGADERALKIKAVLLMAYVEEPETVDPDDVTNRADEALSGSPGDWRHAIGATA